MFEGQVLKPEGIPLLRPLEEGIDGVMCQLLKVGQALYLRDIENDIVVVAMRVGEVNSIWEAILNLCSGYLVCRSSFRVESNRNGLIDHEIAFITLREGLNLHLTTPSGRMTKVFSVAQIFGVRLISIAHITLNIDEIDVLTLI